jgi:Flp pilus assembly pilin Flp
MKNLINAFVKDEDGAVTVDWVVLTAAVVGIAIAVAATIKSGLNSAATSISTGIGTQVGNVLP